MRKDKDIVAEQQFQKSVMFLAYECIQLIAVNNASSKEITVQSVKGSKPQKRVQVPQERRKLTKNIATSSKHSAWDGGKDNERSTFF